MVALVRLMLLVGDEESAIFVLLDWLLPVVGDRGRLFRVVEGSFILGDVRSSSLLEEASKLTEALSSLSSSKTMASSLLDPVLGLMDLFSGPL